MTYIRNLYSHLILKNYLNIFTVIEGTSPDSVTRASERIQLIIDEVNCFFILLKWKSFLASILHNMLMWPCGNLQTVKSSALDYSHFISLPLAINPQLVDKLVNFQNSILGLHDNTSIKASTSASKPKTSTLSGMWAELSL